MPLDPKRLPSDDVAYEIEAMCAAARRYAEGWIAANGATPTGYVDEVFFLEASLLHSRNLYEFLITGSESLRPQHVGDAAHDFAAAKARFEELQPAGSRIYGQLSQFLVHLSLGRWDGATELDIHDPVGLAENLLRARANRAVV